MFARRAFALALAVLCLVGATRVALAGEGTALAPPVSDELRAEMVAAQAEYESRQAWRGTAEGRAVRERSRIAHRGLGRADALALARESFGDVFGRPAFRRFDLPPGMRVRRFIGAYGAVLETADESDGRLVESMGVPLTSAVGSGERDFIDLALEQRGAGYVPRNPVVTTRITAAGRADVGNVGISVAGMAGTDAAVDDGRLFFANGLQDTDVVVSPSARGVQFAFQVRSADAPESAALDLDLPEGASLRKAPVGGFPVAGVEVVVGGEVVGQIRPPVAWDRDREPIAVSYSLEGDRVTVNFPHRNKDLRYPLYVDPLYDEHGAQYGDNWGDGWFTHFNGGSFGSAWGSPARVSSNVGYFYDGNWAALEWQNPRGYIARLYGIGVGHAHAFSCGMFGIAYADVWAGWKSRWAETNCAQTTYDRYPLIYNTEQSYGDRVLLQLYMNETRQRDWSGFVEMYGVQVELAERTDDRPTIENQWNVSNSTGGQWVTAGTPVTVFPEARDAGMGLKTFTLESPAGGPMVTRWVDKDKNTVASDSQACTGLRGSRCPLAVVDDPMTTDVNEAVKLPLDTSGYSEGIHTISGTAVDLFGKGTAFQTTIRIESPNPSGSFAGELWRLLNAQPIVPGNYQLEINTSEGSSGVANVQAFVDSGGGFSPAGFATRVAGTDKFLWTFPAASYADGAANKTVRISAAVTDEVGHSYWVPEFSVTLRPRKSDPLTNPDTQLYAYGVGDIRQENLPTNVYSDLKANNLGFVRMRLNAYVSGFRRDIAGEPWDVTQHDQLVGSIAAAELQLMPILVNQPLGNPRPPAAPPTNAAQAEDLARWAALVAERYGPCPSQPCSHPTQGRFWQENPDLPYRPLLAWEVWNEPNTKSAALGYISPAVYADLLLKTDIAITQKQPTARIVFGGLATSNAQTNYLTYVADTLVQPGALGSFDAVGVHPYHTTADGAYGQVADLRTILSWYSATEAQIWPNEIGWAVNHPLDDDDNNDLLDSNPNDDFTVPDENEQNNRLRALVTKLTSVRDYLKLGPIAWFSLKDNWVVDHDGGARDDWVDVWGDSSGLRTVDESWPAAFDGPNRPSFHSMRGYGYEASTHALP